jgi:hypothetical protein
MRSNTTIAFEEALRRLETDGYPHHQQMALAVPPFLQALMLAYSKNLDARCVRYGILVDELLKPRSTTVFVSLNYEVTRRVERRERAQPIIEERGVTSELTTVIPRTVQHDSVISFRISVSSAL